MRRTFLALVAIIVGLSGCSSSDGILNRHPDGNIIVTGPNFTTLSTSSTAPYKVTAAFTVSISEDAFSGPYSVTMYHWDNNFNEPCFEPHEQSTNVFTFSPDNAVASGPNPCVGNEIETALIRDGKGHDLYFYFEATQAITVAPTPTPAPTASSSTETACSQGDPNTGSVEVTGQVQSITFAPCNDFMVTGTLPANGAANSGLAYATSDTQTFDVTPDASAGTPILSIGLEPGPSEIALTNIASSLTVVVSSASQLGGGQYTMELSENGTVFQETTQIRPSSGSIAFNLHPANGVFDVAEYVAVIYRN